MSPRQQSATVDGARENRRSELAALYLRIGKECQRHREEQRLLEQFRREEQQQAVVGDEQLAGELRQAER